VDDLWIALEALRKIPHGSLDKENKKDSARFAEPCNGGAGRDRTDDLLNAIHIRGDFLSY